MTILQSQIKYSRTNPLCYANMSLVTKRLRNLSAVNKANKQVAQLQQRDCAKLDTFAINVQSYSQNHAQNCIFGPPYGGIRGNTGIFI